MHERAHLEIECKTMLFGNKIGNRMVTFAFFLKSQKIMTNNVDLVGATLMILTNARAHKIFMKQNLLNNSP